MIRFSKHVSALRAVLLMLATALVITSCDCDELIVSTKSGLIKGVDNGDSVAFRGIPYAAPPVGELRWNAPQDPKPWPGVRTADEYGSVCPQVEGPFGAGSTNEDCLYLNVTVPKSRGPFPVMVWIHGGAFVSGSGSDPSYDATRIVEEDVILVTLNYRLGALGFLPHAALADEAGDFGNYGLLDQQKALKWVKENIAAFGGNPRNVTIFGESAGGHSVMSHMAAPSSEGLFDKAIVESGAYSPGQIPAGIGYQIAYGVPFETRAGCTSEDLAEVRECLQNMSVEEVLTAQADDWYVPVTGGAFLPQSILEALNSGEIANVPVLSGCNKNEGRLFVSLDMSNGLLYNTEEEYDAGVAGFLAQDPRQLNAVTIADDYLEMQNPEDANRFRLALSKIWTDYFFNTNNFLQWNMVSAVNDTYAYWFTDDEAPNTFSSPLLQMEATHTLEIQYVFGLVGERGGSEAQVALSEEMVGYWTSFAKTGSPDDSWKTFSSGDIMSYVKKLDTPTADSSALEFCTEHNCQYWAEPPVAIAE